MRKSRGVILEQDVCFDIDFSKKRESHTFGIFSINYYLTVLRTHLNSITLINKVNKIYIWQCLSTDGPRGVVPSTCF